MNRMLEISIELGKRYSGLRMLEVALGHKRQDLEARKLFLTPPTGWEGKNEEQRRTAAEKCFAEDETCKGLATLIRENEGQIAEMMGWVQTLEAERRALEWEVRQSLVDALRANQVQTQGNGPVEETAFDDVTLAEADAAMQAAAEEAIFAGGPYPNGLPVDLKSEEADFPF
jgi:hypothetical protein